LLPGEPGKWVAAQPKKQEASELREAHYATPIQGLEKGTRFGMVYIFCALSIIPKQPGQKRNLHSSNAFPFDCLI
jgi:hypothetical protein